MQKLKGKLSKEEFDSVFRLFARQSWLRKEEQALIDLIRLSDNQDHKNLINDLLIDFTYLDNQMISSCLELICDYIINDSGFSEENTQIAALTYDEEADSSQKILDMIKLPLAQRGWSNFKTVNRYGDIYKNVKKERNQIIFVDEFIGSGKTILGRIRQLKADIPYDFDLKICLIAGMEFAIEKVKEESGYEVYCPFSLKKGISERFIGSHLEEAKTNMIILESKLAQTIGVKNMSSYSFGYNSAETLLKIEGGNTPNSVFPIFWWPRDCEDKKRTTLLFRYETGLL